MENSPDISIQKRIGSNKETILKQLTQTPIIQVACSKAGVGRATYYRWKKDDEDFSQKADEAIIQGRLFINDLAESKLLAAIQDQNMTGIIFWLKHNHPAYTTRVEISQADNEDKNQLKPEEEAEVKKALRLAGILLDKDKEEENEKTGT